MTPPISRMVPQTVAIRMSRSRPRRRRAETSSTGGRRPAHTATVTPSGIIRIPITSWTTAFTAPGYHDQTVSTPRWLRRPGPQDSLDAAGLQRRCNVDWKFALRDLLGRLTGLRHVGVSGSGLDGGPFVYVLASADPSYKRGVATNNLMPTAMEHHIETVSGRPRVQPDRTGATSSDETTQIRLDLSDGRRSTMAPRSCGSCPAG